MVYCLSNTVYCCLLLLRLQVKVEVGAGGLPVGEHPEEADVTSNAAQDKPAYEGEVEAEEVHLVAPHHRHALVDGAV